MQEDSTVAVGAGPRRGGSARVLLGIALLAFIAGLVLAGWIVWGGRLDRYLPARGVPAETQELAGPPSAVSAPSPASPPAQTSGLGALEGRLALLEDRFSRIDAQADAASGNAARAEGLLIAFAARRMIDRGQPLGFLEDQLKLRFADAQPNAVRTLIEASRNPVTLDKLVNGLDAHASAVVQTPAEMGAWSRIKHEVASLFIVRSASTPAREPRKRFDRARRLLVSGQVGAAIAEVEALPGAGSAGDWLAQARRHDAVQQALDLIETTAMLEPHRLNDSEGRKVDQPSPLSGSRSAT